MPGMTTTSEVMRYALGIASMRPRLNAGDDRVAVAVVVEDAAASMRPRLNAGDDWMARSQRWISLTGFNEAPAKCRG